MQHSGVVILIKINVIFHNLRSYNTHLIIKEIIKFDAKASYQMDSENTWLLQLIEIESLLTVSSL